MENGDLKLYDLHDEEKVQKILGTPDEHLKNVLSFNKSCIEDVKLAFRDMNIHSRSLYASFIKKAGRNIYPLIIASEYDYDNELGSGVNTFTLYLEDGKEFRITPNANNAYAIYKSTAHIFFALTAILTPYLENPEARGWKKPLLDYKESIETGLASLDACIENFLFKLDKKPVQQILRSSLDFIVNCLQDGSFSFEGWQTFNKNNFDAIILCFKLATEAQADANVEALLEWKKMLGPELWREIYVFIPTVWPVSKSNPRIELFRNIMDKDRIDTHIIASEWPRNEGECRTTLGRVIGDRAMSRFVFGDENCKARMKVVSLSTEVDAVQDDFIPALNKALISHGVKTSLPCDLNKTVVNDAEKLNGNPICILNTEKMGEKGKTKER